MFRDGVTARHFEPVAIDRHRFLGVDDDIAGAIFFAGLFDADALVPAVHAADRVGVDCVSEVLSDAAVGNARVPRG